MGIGFGKELYSVRESYRIYFKGLRTIKYMTRAKKRRDLSPEFIERIMMAVTEVNGCTICSYAHTKMALEIGMHNEEIQNILSGVMDDIPPDETAGVMFAQHYADNRGKPSKKAWEYIVGIYGLSKTKGILGSIRMIMIGNIYGIPWSSFFNRFRGKPDKRSNFLYEISMIITCIVFTPIVIIHALVSDLFQIPVISFEKE